MASGALPPMPATANTMIIEESKDQLDPLLAQGRRGDVLFTTKENDPDNFYIKGKPVTYVAINIPSYMGGRANPWANAVGKVGLYNPFSKTAPKSQNQPKNLEKQLNFGK